MSKLDLGMSGGRALQTEGTASAKAQRPDVQLYQSNSKKAGGCDQEGVSHSNKR